MTMRYMALRKSPGTEASEDAEPLSEPRYASIVTVYDPITTVTIDPTPCDSRSGACECQACAAARLAELNIRFQPG